MVTSAYVLKVINLTVTAKDVSTLMSARQKPTTANTCASTLSVHSSATVHEDLSKRKQRVSTEMNAENNQESVVAEVVFAKTILAVIIVSALVDTEWTKEETSALILMNAVVV